MLGDRLALVFWGGVWNVIGFSHTFATTLFECTRQNHTFPEKNGRFRFNSAWDHWKSPYLSTKGQTKADWVSRVNAKKSDCLNSTTSTINDDFLCDSATGGESKYEVGGDVRDSVGHNFCRNYYYGLSGAADTTPGETFVFGKPYSVGIFCLVEVLVQLPVNMNIVEFQPCLARSLDDEVRAARAGGRRIWEDRTARKYEKMGLRECSQSTPCICKRKTTPATTSKTSGSTHLVGATANLGGAISCQASQSSTGVEMYTLKSNSSCGEQAVAYFDSSEKSAAAAGNTLGHYACFGDGVQIGRGAVIQGNTAKELGGGVFATLCDVTITGAELIENCVDGGDGGAVTLQTGASLKTREGSVFSGNMANMNGGGIACLGCEKISLKDGTIFRQNSAELGNGGAVFVSAVVQPSKSTSSQFLANSAKWDGGAVFASDYQRNGQWYSYNDTFKSNVAKLGSGGGVAAEGTTVTLCGATQCIGNKAERGGGGCLFWEPLALDAKDAAWQAISPAIGEKECGPGAALSTEGNRARFSNENGLATPPVSVEVSASVHVATFESGRFQHAPEASISDWYGTTVRVGMDGANKDFSDAGQKQEGAAGILSQPLSLTSSLFREGPTSARHTTELFGDVSATVNPSTGKATFNELNARGAPKSGPHDISVKATFTLANGKRRKISSSTPIRSLIDLCAGDTVPWSDGVAAGCRACDKKQRPSSDSTHCLCRGTVEQLGGGQNMQGFYNTTNDCDDGAKYCCAQCPPGANCMRRDGLLFEELTPLPGWWREKSSDAFSDCAAGYKGSLDAEQLAKKRCCPPSDVANGSSSICEHLIGRTGTTLVSNGTLATTSCLEGYVGALCRACDVGLEYVAVGSACLKCNGGAQMAYAVTTLLSSTVMVYVVMVLVLVCCVKDSKKGVHAANKVSGMLNQAKIMIHFAQILAAMPVAMDGMPWPIEFKSFALSLTFINLDVLDAFVSPDTCALSVPVLDKFTLHMFLPPLLIMTIFAAYATSSLIDRARAKSLPEDSSSKMKKQKRKETSAKMLILSTLLIYPGLATRIFSVFRCESVAGTEYVKLSLDYSVECWTGDHSSKAVGAVICLILYVVGVPACIFAVLFKNRKALYDVSHPKHEEVKFELGGLYASYESSYWFWELVIILQKLLMTGAVSIVSPGSPVQMVFAIMIMICYLLGVLKAAPYESPVDDWMSALTTFAIVLTTFFGLLLRMDNDPEDLTFDPAAVGNFLVGINLTVFFIEMAVMLATTERGAKVLRKLRRGGHGGEVMSCEGEEMVEQKNVDQTSEEDALAPNSLKKKKKNGGGTKVTPSAPPSGDGGAEIRSWS